MFDAAAAQTLFEAAGVTVRVNDFDPIAALLDNAASNFVTNYRQSAAARAGERQRWLRLVQKRARDLLDAFDMREPWAQPRHQAKNALLRDAPAADPREFSLRGEMGRAVGASAVPGEWDAAAGALHGVRWLALRAETAAAELEAKKNAPRRPPAEELRLVWELDTIFVAATGERRAYTIDDFNETQGGPFVDFVAEACAHIRANLDAFEPLPDRDEGMSEALEKLSFSSDPARIIRRIRDVRSHKPPSKG